MAGKLSKWKNGILAVSLLLLALFVVQGVLRESKEGEEDAVPYTLWYKQGGVGQRIRGFRPEGKGGTVYFFLPGYMQVEDVKVEMGRSQSLTVEKMETEPGKEKTGTEKEEPETPGTGKEEPETPGTEKAEPGALEEGREAGEMPAADGEGQERILRNGDTLEGIVLGQQYRTRFRSAGMEREFLVIFLQGSDIPAVRLATASGAMDYIYEKKGNAESGYIQALDATGQTDCLAKAASISGRGNTSWDGEKKPFLVKLDEAQDLFGMGAAKNWVLCPNYYDGAYIRNQAGLELAQAGGIAYSAQAQFVDLYINEEYMGLYQLMERVEAGKNRVDIGKRYLLEIDYQERAEEEEAYITLPNDQPVVIHAPGKNRDVDGVQQFFDTFANRMESWDVPVENMDLASFAKMFVMEDIYQDMDFGYTSHYMYLDLEKGVLTDGPVWDLDNTMGRGIVREAQPFFVLNYDQQYNNLSRWYARLFGLEQFRKMAVSEYWENFRPSLEALVKGGVRERVGAIAESIAMDQRRYTGERSVFMSQATLEEHVEYLENYLADKLKEMDACYTESVAESRIVTEFPPLESQPLALEEGQGQEESGRSALEILMKFRFPFLLLVMVISGMILWKRQTGYAKKKHYL